MRACQGTVGGRGETVARDDHDANMGGAQRRTLGPLSIQPATRTPVNAPRPVLIRPDSTRDDGGQRRLLLVALAWLGRPVLRAARWAAAQVLAWLDRHLPTWLTAPIAVLARVLRILGPRRSLNIARWLGTVALVASIVVLVSGLNRDASQAGQTLREWEAGAGLVVAPPDVTPIDGWNAYNAHQRAIIEEIALVFGPDSQAAQGAVNVAYCESGYDPHNRNPISVAGSHAEGVFQILWPSTWQTTSFASQSPYDQHANILAAHQIWERDGHSWGEWCCQPDGKAYC